MGEQRRFRKPSAGPPTPGREPDDSAEPADPDEGFDRVDLTRTFSAREVLRTRDFAEFTPEEMLQARQLMASLQWNPGLRRTRRKEAGRGPGLDVRRTLRRNARFGGELVHLETRRRKQKPRRLVVVCDMSGSMERYTRMLLHFIHSLYAGLDNRIEAFLFATRLTRITKHLGQRDIDRAVSEVAKAVPDWSGGTAHRRRTQGVQLPLGAAHARLGGSIVLIVSDGWDRGEPELLAREMARLQRSCSRLIWLNPLAGNEDYEPLTVGMQAAAPYIDDLLPVNNLAALLDLAEHLNNLSQSRPVRHQHTSRPVEEEATVAAAPAQQQRSWHASANPTFRHPHVGTRGAGGRGIVGRDQPSSQFDMLPTCGGTLGHEGCRLESTKAGGSA